VHFTYPAWSADLKNMYWHLRASRPWDTALRRRWYRIIQGEKKRLLLAGVPYIELHLVTRVLCDPRNNNYQMRLANYQKQLRMFAEPSEEVLS
jgi:hypothetical protein